MKLHFPRAQAACLDLPRLLEDDAVSGIIGTLQKLMRNGRGHWHDLHRVGTSEKNRYLGEDSPEMAARVARHADLVQAAKARAEERSRLVRTLRADGLASLDRTTGSLLLGMERAGVFRLGGTLVRTQAVKLHKGKVAVRLGEPDLTQTGDIDNAQLEYLSLALGDKVEENLAETFKALDFDPVPGIQTTSVWKRRQSKSTAMVKFLPHLPAPKKTPANCTPLVWRRKSLHLLDFLIAKPIKAADLYRSGVLVHIPRPEAYAVQKLSVADRRKAGPDQIKSRKDSPDVLRAAYADAPKRGPQWRPHIAASLAPMPKTAARLGAV